jgi:lycopene beta-cyclase
LSCDVLLVGGGLANSLIALEMKSRRPDLRVVMLERRTERDVDHTWCVFKTDLSDRSWDLLSPLFDNVWPSYDIAFPTHSRRLATPYARLTSERLGERIEAVLGADLVRGAAVSAVTPSGADCDDGRRFFAPLVIDGRGFTGSAALRLAYQKFVGLEVELDRPHELNAPIVMDATVAQLDGFRFLYVLPLATDRLLIEDTRYSNGSNLDVAALTAEAHCYAAVHGWTIKAVARSETGVLPVVLDGDIGRFWRETVPGVPTVGVAGAFFHPTTGYSLPFAARVATAIADHPKPTSDTVRRLTERMSKQGWARGRLYRGLNRMMFEVAEPENRYRVLQRFYTLPWGLIERFYASRLSPPDQLRILVGKPPIPMAPALWAFLNMQGRL